MRPTAPLCRLKCVLIHSSSWLCTTELYKCINATGMNTFMMHYTLMAQWMRNIRTSSLDQVLNSSEAVVLIMTHYLGRAFYQCVLVVKNDVSWQKYECSLTFCVSCSHSFRPECVFHACVCQWVWLFWLHPCMCCSAICCIGQGGLCTAGCMATGIAG